MALEPRRRRKELYVSRGSFVFNSISASRPGLNRWNCASFMKTEPSKLRGPSFPHIWAKMRKQKKAKPSSPCAFIFSLITTRFEGVFSAWRNWLNSKSTLKESTMSCWYLCSNLEKDGTNCGVELRICARAMSCMLGGKAVDNSSLNSLIFPRAWMAMKTRAASTTSGVESFTVFAIHVWIQAHDCFDNCSSWPWLRMKASCWSATSQYMDNIAAKVCSRCAYTAVWK
mmetsp:Transcript_128723/g.372475  ORF Transcript_128723/g.372475 Transcript_128723/m.372475 type:complete len:228 (-) Transcript_128723:1109-1792(-)